MTLSSFRGEKLDLELGEMSSMRKKRKNVVSRLS